MIRRALIPLAALAVLTAPAACSSDDATTVCASHGLPGSPDGTREPDVLCRDNHDAAPAFVWLALQPSTAVPAVGQPLGPAATSSTPKASGSAQSDDEEDDAGVNPSGGSSSAATESEEEATSSSVSEEESSEVSSSVSVSEE